MLAFFLGARVEGILLGRDEMAWRQLPLELLAVRRALLVPRLTASRRRLGTCLTHRRNVDFGSKLTLPAPGWKSSRGFGQPHVGSRVRGRHE